MSSGLLNYPSFFFPVYLDIYNVFAQWLEEKEY